MDDEKKWNGVTLEDCLIAMFEAGQERGEDMKTLVRFFGKERVRAIYDKWKKEQEDVQKH